MRNAGALMQVNAIAGVEKSFAVNAKVFILKTMIEVIHRSDAPWWLKVYLFFCFLFDAGVVIRDPIADDEFTLAYRRLKYFKDTAYVLSEWGGKYEKNL